MIYNKDELILRDLAKLVMEIGKKDIQDERRKLWRDHNSLIKTRPLVLVSVGWWDVLKTEIITEKDLKCEDLLYRDIEFKLRQEIFQDTVGDDYIVEPWIKIDPIYNISDWGVKIDHIESEQAGGAYKFDPPIIEEGDFSKFKMPSHSINEEETKGKFDKIQQAIGDLIPLVLNRGPSFIDFAADISYWLAQHLGMEEMMYHMYDRPEWMHKVLKFFRDGILKVHEESEKVGDWKSINSINQAMAYSKELHDPIASDNSVLRKDLWGFFAAQEFALISPEMHEEFLLQYQLPIMEKMGLVAYGCCEDLTHKIDILRKIPNLRRIAVTPWADVRKSAEQIGKDYVMSWRPNPAEMVCTDWDPNRVKKIVKDAMEASKDGIVDITLKDVQTVKNEPQRLSEWVKVTREISDNY